MITKEDGSIIIDEEFSPVTTPLYELTQLLKRTFYDTFGFLFLLLTLPFLWLLNKFSPYMEKRIMVGTHPIVSNIHYKSILKDTLKEEYEVDSFIFVDWLNESSYYDIKASDILPKWIIISNPYAIAPYFILLWSLRRYKGFWWHMDGAILERTLLWRIEPLLLQLFEKKLIMSAFGADQWSLLQSSHNLNFKLGLASHRKRYFMMDFKRLERNYMWAKYANYISGDFRYLPRVNATSMAHYYIDLENLPFNINENMDTIIISHFANHPERKGSYAIEAICKELKSEGYKIEYRAIHGVSRAEALSILDESHIFIEHLFNGSFGTAALEASAKGNVVLTNIDKRMIDLFLVQHYEFYAPFFKNMPIKNIDVTTLKGELIKLVQNKQELKKLIYESREFIEKATNNIVGQKEEGNYVIKSVFLT
ncbi:MAG: hypothetical protein PHS42_01770 [Sulfurimonas sp.]|nr:hypothetical protein [Sulfurimonas sp.]MDD3834177.1 hypothetical protein [Sulfurimonas sp.]